MLTIHRFFSESSSRSFETIQPFIFRKNELGISLWAMFYGTYFMIYLPFPITLPITMSNMEYAGLIMASFIEVTVVCKSLRYG